MTPVPPKPHPGRCGHDAEPGPVLEPISPGATHHRRQKRRQTASLSAPIGGTDNETEFIDLIASDEATPDSPLSNKEQAELVKKVVDELPPHYREILLLSYFQKMSYGQIADSLDIPLGTVKSRLHSAVASFSESWKLAAATAEPDQDAPADN